MHYNARILFGRFGLISQNKLCGNQPERQLYVQIKSFKMAMLKVDGYPLSLSGQIYEHLLSEWFIYKLKKKHNLTL